MGKRSKKGTGRHTIQKSRPYPKTEDRTNPIIPPMTSSDKDPVREPTDSISVAPPAPELNHPVDVVEDNSVAVTERPGSDSFASFLSDTKIANLFVILIGVGTMISLLPIFLDFFIGSDWLNVFLKDEFGFKTLLSMIIAVITGLIFMIIILVYIVYEFLKKIFYSNFSTADKICSTFFLLFGVISFFCIFYVILNVWEIKALAQKFEIILVFSLLLIILSIGTLFGIIMYVALFIEDLKRFFQIILDNLGKPCYLFIKTAYCDIKSLISNRIAENSLVRTIPRGIIRWITPTRRAILIALIPFAVIGILLYLFCQVLIPTNTLISNYYNDTDKKLDITLGQNDTLHSKGTPSLLNITYSLNDTNNRLETFDYSYLECHWTTNYGYFIKMDPDSHKVEQRNDVISIYSCPTAGNIFWTYDVSDYGKNKPDVFIGLTIEDSNKDRILGSDRLKVNWSDSDTIYIERINETNLSENH